MAEQTLRIDLRCRNNVLWHAIFDTWSSVADFARTFNLSQGRIGRLLNLQENPYHDTGLTLKPLAKTIAAAVSRDGYELFPWSLYAGHFSVNAVYEVDAEQVISLSAARRLTLETPSIDMNIINKALETLTPRERHIIDNRYNGTDSNRTVTYRDLGNDMSLSPARVRQIERKALLKLRHPARQLKHARLPEERTAVHDPIPYHSRWNWPTGERVLTPESWTGIVRNQRVRANREEILVECTPGFPGRWFWGIDLKRI